MYGECYWLFRVNFWNSQLYFKITFQLATPLGHKPGLEPDQGQARPGPQLRAGLEF